MTKQEIVEEIAKNKVIEEILGNIVQGHYEDWYEDLVQDLYYDLLTKPEQLLQHLYTTKAIKFFLTRMIINNIRSLNGPAFKNYIKWDMLKSENGINEEDMDDE